MNYPEKTYRYLISCLIYIALAAVMTGCDQDTEEERSGSGMIKPAITVDATVYTASGSISTGIVGNIPNPTDIALRISSADGQYSAEWPKLSEYPLNEPYRPGHYRVEALYGSNSGEGFDSPFFYGDAAVEVIGGQTSAINICCKLANSIFDISFAPGFMDYFSNPSALLHSEGGDFLRFTPEENRLAYIKPGNISLIINGITPEGTVCEFLATTIENVQAQNFYNITLDIQQGESDTPRLIISFEETTSGDDVVIDLTPEFLQAEAPDISAIGFTSGTAITIPEGDTPVDPTGFTISGAHVNSVILTTKAQSLINKGWPAEIDLTKADRSTLSLMQRLGLKLTGNGSDISDIDLTETISRLLASDSEATFSLMATGAEGKISGPVSLNIKVMPVDISIVSISDALLGINIAEMTVIAHSDNLADNLAIQFKTSTSTAWTDAEILSIEPKNGSTGEWIVKFSLPAITTPTAELRVLYCNEEKARQTIDFVSPEFTISVDAFAQLAVVKIAPKRPEMLEIITSLAKIYINSSQSVNLTRDNSRGLIIVGGLAEHTHYSICATLFDDPTDKEQFTESVTIETERMLSVPNGSFEEVKKWLKNEKLPSGGRYSQNIVDIYNQQNYTTYDYYIPKGWANVNAKTFCTAAANKNTWYMQPSAFSISECMEGAYAVCLQTVGWDTNGPTIPDYRQTTMPYVSYSRNIPEIAHRAAGKLFLGEYGFDPATGQEVYIEGVPFASRPISVNGFYKFLPAINDVSDRGKVDIEIIGNLSGADIVIARATKLLTPATGYTAFSIPLTYSDFGVKATRLKIMISSSQTTGDIATESAGITTYSDPATSTSIGGVLWIDDLTFSY